MIAPHNFDQAPEGNIGPNHGNTPDAQSSELVRRFREKSLLVLTECRRIYEQHNKFRHLVDAIVQGQDDYSGIIEELSREGGGVAMLSELEQLVARNPGDHEGTAVLTDLSLLLNEPAMRAQFVDRASRILELSHELTSTIHSVATVMRCIAFDHPGPRSAAKYGSANIAGKGTLMMFERGLHTHPMSNMPSVELPGIMREMEQLCAHFMQQMKQ